MAQSESTMGTKGRGWQAGVRMGAHAALTDQDARWEYGDALVKAMGEPPVDQSNDGSMASMEQWREQVAAEAHIDVDMLPATQTLGHYRIAAAMFGKRQRVGLSINAAYEIAVAHRAGNPEAVDPAAFARSVRNKDGVVTVDAIRRALGKTPTRFAPPSERPIDEVTDDVVKRTPEEKRALVDALAEDPRTRMRMRAAAFRHEDAARDQVDSEERAGMLGGDPETRDAAIQMAMDRALAEVRWTAEKAARRWQRDRENLSEQAYADVREDIAEEHVKVSSIFDAMLGTNIDQQLAKLLSEEGSA